MKFLLIERPTTINLIKSAILSDLNIEATTCHTSIEALEEIKKDLNIKMIITRDKIDEDLIAKSIANYLYDHQRKVPMLVLGDFEFTGIDLVTLPEGTKIFEVLRQIKKLLKLKDENIAEIKLPEFIPYSISNLFLMNSSAVDLYIKLTQKGGDRYIKRIHSKDEFDREALLRYQKAGMDYIYIRKDERHLFWDDSIEQTLKKLEETNLSEDEALMRGSDSYQVAQNLILSSGISPESVKMAEGSINHMTNNVISKKSELGNLLKALLSNNASFNYRHSYLLSILFYQTAPYLDWVAPQQIQATLKKFVFVSYFHDILLTPDKLCTINNVNELVAANLSKEEKKLVEEHANMSASLLQSYPHCPSGADIIVKQHHGSGNGIGFPRSFTSNISPMSIAFLVIEDFAHQLLKQSKDSLILPPEIIKSMLIKYELPSYKKAIKSLAQALKVDLGEENKEKS